MELAHFVYTKHESSPFKKTGFHFCGYTLCAFSAKELLHLETHIHYPEIPEFKEKRTFCVVAGRPFVMFMTAMPDERDSFGRKGMFIVHGMELPKSIFEGHKSLAGIFDGLEGYVFRRRRDAFEGGCYRPETGDLSPLNVADEIFARERTIIPMLSVAERAALLTTLKSETENEAALCLEAPPNAALAFFDKIYAWLPPASKTRFAFDEAFDGGKIFFFPIKLTAYTRVAPVTAMPVFVIRDTAGPLEATQRWAVADGWFARWAGKETTPYVIEKAWALDDFLSRKTLVAPDPDEEWIDDFAAANENELRRLSEKSLSETLEPALAAAVARSTAPSVLLKIVIGGFDPRACSKVVEEVVSQTKYFGSKALPPAFETPFLRLISRLWENKPVSLEEYQALPLPERRKFCAYLSDVRPSEPNDWVCDLMARSENTPELWDYLGPMAAVCAHKRLPKAFAALKDLPAFAVQSRVLPPDDHPESWTDVLESYCAAHPQAWNTVAKIVKGGQYSTPYLAALSRPDTVDFLQFSPDERRRFVPVLRGAHRWNRERLKAAGFENDDSAVENENPVRRWWQKLFGV